MKAEKASPGSAAVNLESLRGERMAGSTSRAGRGNFSCKFIE
jgi:hypothetical protein